MHDLTAAKAIIRRDLRARRRQIDAGVRATEQAAACAMLARLVLASRPAAVATYAALPDELDLTAFHEQCWRAGIAVLLPRVADTGVLTWHRLADAAACVHLRTGAFGIAEPDPSALPALALPSHIPLIVPGLGFTADGRRLGQGGGFYDRLLVEDDHRSVGVGFSCQLVDDLPCEPHDRRLAALVIAGRLVLGGPDTAA